MALTLIYYNNSEKTAIEMANQSSAQQKHSTPVDPLLLDDVEHSEEYVADSLVEEMRLRDCETFYCFTRMSIPQFELLLSKVRPVLQKHSIRQPINEKDRLLTTLRYLTTGMSFSSLANGLPFGKSTIHKIVKETTSAIWITLKGEYLRLPSLRRMIHSARLFFKKTGMPNCIGVIGGKRFVCTQHSIALLAVCDTKYRFTYINVQHCGDKSFDELFDSCNFGEHLMFDDLDLPIQMKLPNSKQQFPLYFIGDATLPLQGNLMRAYPEEDITLEQEMFNERLSTARKLIERSFAIFSNTFGICDRIRNCTLANAIGIIKSILLLHNFILSTKHLAVSMHENVNVDDGYYPDATNEIPSYIDTAEGIELRDKLKDYLMENF